MVWLTQKLKLIKEKKFSNYIIKTKSANKASYKRIGKEELFMDNKRLDIVSLDAYTQRHFEKTENKRNGNYMAQQDKDSTAPIRSIHKRRNAICETDEQDRDHLKLCVKFFIALKYYEEYEIS